VVSVFFEKRQSWNCNLTNLSNTHKFKVQYYIIFYLVFQYYYRNSFCPYSRRSFRTFSHKMSRCLCVCINKLFVEILLPISYYDSTGHLHAKYINYLFQVKFRNIYLFTDVTTGHGCALGQFKFNDLE